MAEKCETVTRAWDLICKASAKIRIAQLLLEPQHSEEAETAGQLYGKLEELELHLYKLAGKEISQQK